MSSDGTIRAKWLPAAYAALLFAVNAVIVQRLFATEFIQQTSSNEGSFMAISRFLVERWPHVRWFPFWLNGVPFENTYFPFLQVTIAIVAKALHCSTASAYHAATAFFYCLGPVCLFLFAWKASGLPRTAFLSGLAYSLFSPSLLVPAVRADMGSWHNARRLQTLVQYGEGNHNTGLSLLPLALLCAWMAITRRRFGWGVACGITMAVLVLTNAFASVSLAIGIVLLTIVQPPGRCVRSLALLACIGGVTYLWVSPVLTPDLLRTIHTNSLNVEGNYHYTARMVYGGLLTLAGGFSLWFLTRRWRDWFLRFSVLFTYIFSAVVALTYFGGVAILPQPWRYQLEMETGICLVLVFGAGRVLAFAHPWVRTISLALFAGFLFWQAIWYWDYTRGLVQPIDITRTIEYKTSKWIDTNLRGLRTMVSGDTGYWFNIFTDNPQLSSAPDPFSPNWMVEIAAHTIYTGQNAGARDADYSVLWLKAFGCHAITVPGPKSSEAYHPIRNPRKFEGVLPLIWHDEDDSIYGVPQRSKSLAHVIPADAVVRHPPIHGLDVEEVARFVDAMENPALPLADFAWLSDTGARIVTEAHPGQAVAVQVTYDPGWVASVNGRSVLITRDGIGLMTLHPACDGRCDISLSYELGAQRRICIGLSALVTLGLAVAGALRGRADALKRTKRLLSFGA